MYISGFVHDVMSFMSTSYLHLPICTFSERKRNTLSSVLTCLTNKVRNLFLLLCPGFFSDRFCSLGVGEEEKTKKKTFIYAKSKI